jgi:hypothetical protein
VGGVMVLVNGAGDDPVAGDAGAAMGAVQRARLLQAPAHAFCVAAGMEGRAGLGRGAQRAAGSGLQMAGRQRGRSSARGGGRTWSVSSSTVTGAPSARQRRKSSAAPDMPVPAAAPHSDVSQAEQASSTTACGARRWRGEGAGTATAISSAAGLVATLRCRASALPADAKSRGRQTVAPCGFSTRPGSSAAAGGASPLVMLNQM